ncbi:MAG: hypothetical protein RLZZ196_202 [Bacteroidota bacterium]|jgi:hypothetical protein
MADLDYNEDDLQEDYDYFFEKYQPVEYDVTDDNREFLKTVDPKFVWTNHSTCTNEYLSPGFHEFSPNSCCWQEFVWYVSETPWESDDSSQWILVSDTFPCPDCNPDNDEDMSEGNPDCTICEGNAFYQYYAD